MVASYPPQEKGIPSFGKKRENTIGSGQDEGKKKMEHKMEQDVWRERH